MYYRLDWKAPRGTDFANTLDSPPSPVPWTMGTLHDEVRYPVPQPLVCNLHPRRGRELRDVFLVDIPLFSARMLEVLHHHGVNNLQRFDAVLRAPDGTLHEGYEAVNLVGLVACADMERSRYLPGSSPPLVEFSELVIDERKAGGAPFFRLAESSLVILVSEPLQRAMVEAGLRGFSLVPVAS